MLRRPVESALFTPVWVAVEGYDTLFSLYRSSFMHLGDQILYADSKGKTGTLQFGRHVVADSARQLLCPTDVDCAFALQLGLKRGVFYSVEDVMEKLEQQGMVWMLGQPSPWARATSISQALCPVKPADERVADTTRSPLALAPSSFYFEDGDLYYRDHDGQPGLLVFNEHLGGAGSRFQLIEEEYSRASVFAAQCRLQPGVDYTEGEIVWRLRSEGFNLVQDDDA